LRYCKRYNLAPKEELYPDVCFAANFFLVVMQVR
jgi:hypothetical protein